MPKSPTLPWLAPGEAFPPLHLCWGDNDPIPGLLCAGGALDVETLLSAYSQGIFPWFSPDQPILWWSPNPRMLLRTADFKLRPSLLKTLRAGLRSGQLGIRIDTAFEQVIHHCAHTPRDGQSGTWIVPDMVSAFTHLHRAGHAHSVETWWNGTLVGGLYCVNIGGMVFGESMFSHRSDASKIALAALVALCRHHGLAAIDCQQNTPHLASLGAHEVSRTVFMQTVAHAMAQPRPSWEWHPVYWKALSHTLTVPPAI